MCLAGKHKGFFEYGSHTCLIFDDFSEYQMVAMEYVSEGIENNELVICVIDEYNDEEFLRDLRTRGINADEMIHQGRLIISSITNSLRRLNHWCEVISSNKDCRGIRVMGEGTFSIDGSYKSLVDLIEYEIRLNIEVLPFFEKQQYLCVYNKSLYPNNILKSIIQAHTSVIHKSDYYKNNPYHLEPMRYLDMLKADVDLYANFGLMDDEKMLNIEAGLRSDEARLFYIIDSVADGVWDYNILNDSLYFNSQIYDLLKCDRSYLGNNLKSFVKRIHPKDRKNFIENLNAHIKGSSQKYKNEYRIKSGKSEWIWLEDKGRGFSKDENGQITRIVSSVINITERKNAEKELERLNKELLKNSVGLKELNAILEEEINERERMAKELNMQTKFNDAIFNSIPGLISLIDSEGHLIHWNKQHEEITGYTAEEIKNMKYEEWNIDEESLALSKEAYGKAIENGYSSTVNKIRKKDGSYITVYFNGTKLVFDDKEYIIVIGIDMSERLAIEQKNLYLSYHDVLTGIYNRRFYEEEGRRLDTERNLPISIIIGDVNGLKLINDAFGHMKGDELLVKAAAAIKTACRKDDIIARWGGDEFIILLPNTDSVMAENIEKRIRQLYSNEYVNSIQLSMSFGHATKYDSDTPLSTVLKEAEDSMYRNKIAEKESVRGSAINTIINALHEKNPREEQHSKRVAELAEMIARRVDLSETEIKRIKTIGLLHDIGKIAIEENILNKNGKLLPEEYEQIKKHPEIGYRILSSSHEMQEISDCVLSHHERWDGKGYPKGLKGEGIPKISRIIAIADAYDAMISNRPYRNAMTEEEALQELRKYAGIQFDPELVDEFVEGFAKT